MVNTEPPRPRRKPNHDSLCVTIRAPEPLTPFTSERQLRSHPELYLVAQTNAGALGAGHVNLPIVERIAAGGLVRARFSSAQSITTDTKMFLKQKSPSALHLRIRAFGITAVITITLFFGQLLPSALLLACPTDVIRARHCAGPHRPIGTTKSLRAISGQGVTDYWNPIARPTGGVRRSVSSAIESEGKLQVDGCPEGNDGRPGGNIAMG
jgi:hypothetical protein